MSAAVHALKDQYDALAPPIPPHLAALVKQLETQETVAVRHATGRPSARGLRLLGLKLPQRELYSALNDPRSRGRLRPPSLAALVELTVILGQNSLTEGQNGNPRRIEF